MHDPVVRPRLTLAVVLLTALIFPLAITGPSVALPHLQRELSASLTAVQWVITGYNTTFAAGLTFAGALADRFGHRQLFMVGTGLFTVAGLGAAVAPSILVVDLCRVLGGFGAAAAAAAGTSLIVGAFDGRARSKAFGLQGTALGLGMAFGPTVCGAIVAVGGWRPVLAVPAAVAGLACLAALAIPQPARRTPQPADWAGGLLFTVALLITITVLVQAPVWGPQNPLLWGLLAVAVAVTVTFVLIERRVAHPMLPIDILLDPRFAGYALTSGVMMAVMVPQVVQIPTHLDQQGVGAAQVGLWLLALTLPPMVLPPIGARIAVSHPRALVVTALALAAAGTLLMGWNSDRLPMVISLLATGIAVGLTLGVTDGLAMAVVDPARVGAASGLLSTVRMTVETISLALSGSVVAFALTRPGATFADALQTMCLCLAVAGAVGAVFVARLLNTGVR
ncbi:MFS transporter [Propionibacteriaceae bacterium Y1700]|uniref:MFS transporter n=1 Tax=Microlunatus sp. Y1700 TaxID=3418487 RepID=UPI003DA6FABF